MEVHYKAKYVFFDRGQISQANRRENLRDGGALSRMDFSTFGGDIFRSLQIGDQNARFVFGVSSSLCVVNTTTATLQWIIIVYSADGRRLT